MRVLSRLFTFLGTHPVVGGVVALLTAVGTAVALLTTFGLLGRDGGGLKAPVIAVDADARPHGTGRWRGSIPARPGDQVDLLLTIRNLGNGRAHNVEASFALDSTGDLRYVDRSCQLAIGSAAPRSCSDAAVVGGGFQFGGIAPRRTIYVRITVDLKTSARGAYSFDATADSDETQEDTERGEIFVRLEP